MQTVCSGASVTPVTYAVGGLREPQQQVYQPVWTVYLMQGYLRSAVRQQLQLVPYNYTVTTSGGCGVATANGSITISRGALSATREDQPQHVMYHLMERLRLHPNRRRRILYVWLDRRYRFWANPASTILWQQATYQASRVWTMGSIM